jgi:hypothetical protein
MTCTPSGGSNPLAPFDVQFFCSNPDNLWGFGGPLDDDYDVKPYVTYRAWCMDEDHSFAPGYLSVKLLSCFDPALPLAYQHLHWGAVAWLINNRSEWTGVSLTDMKEIFYVLLDQTDFHSVPASGLVHDLYIKALLHDSYRPGAGSLIPVVTTDQGNTPGFQIMFVEIDP